jgi:hypothetical protein
VPLPFFGGRTPNAVKIISRQQRESSPKSGFGEAERSGGRPALPARLGLPATRCPSPVFPGHAAHSKTRLGSARPDKVLAFPKKHPINCYLVVNSAEE